jgi:hypothetical protein
VFNGWNISIEMKKNLTCATEREIEEREYGFPWYARSESPYRDDEED